ncbi:DEAD/DEAH box helicase [Methanocella arvoryzae]|uniref:ATP-dependent RNA helicase n=1 Tax=Methanocella arvoryzae (strain DSM 22066 / NBRC 105507 / MRE50) TaxID=351160 RepID=Q0W8H7_METAR|nr:DEAD/DEAH box helicase [Methanocella arvoryzae]CAJ35316.1 ATP-dependent RNA helicase [Methanocella arvoryzae MRE50]
MVKFTELNLTPSIVRAVHEMGFEEATPIQEQAIPLAMEGKDLIGQARTGTGKTAAFGIPMVEAIRPTSKGVQGLVVVPTRELAVQVAEELTRIGKVRGIRSVAIYGGQDFRSQVKALEELPHIVVGTPGRLLEHMRREYVRTSDIRIAVLDEADKMLDMGFIDEAEKILKKLPERRQTLLFSATLSPPVQMLARKYLKDPELIEFEEEGITVPTTVQYYIEMPEKQKFEALTRLLDQEKPELAIVFVATRIRVGELAKALVERGYHALGLHGDLLQYQRENTLDKFKAGEVSILVATDVAARGLDIQGVTHVYNFDIPRDPDSYVHRIGRTGRAGNAGTATTFVTPKDKTALEAIEQAIDHQITSKPAPGGAESTEKNIEAVIEKIRGEIEIRDLSFYRDYAESLLNSGDPATILAAALRILSKAEEKPQIRLTEIPEPVAPDRKAEKGHGKGTGHPKKGSYSKGYGHKDEGDRKKAGAQKPKGSAFKQFAKKGGKK